MTDAPFAGVYPAMTTPFHEDGSIDFETLQADAQRLEAAGVAGLVPVGSTGESATLTHDEHIEVVDAVVDAVSDIPVIAGAGSNSTHEAISLSQRSEDVGAAGLLHLSPYYNKPEPDGMEHHFREVAENVDIPIIVYNVPSRTGRNIALETVESLATHPMIRGYKAASGDMGRISQVIERTRDAEFAVLSGDDGMTYPILATGGTGVISVAANVFPEPHCEMVDSALAGDYEHARDIHHDLAPLFRAMFIETNPIPVKEAMHLVHDAPPYLRSPLSRIRPDDRSELESVLEHYETEPVTA